MSSTARLPVRRTRVLSVDTLSAADIGALAEQLRPAFEQSFGPIAERAFIETFITRGPGCRLAVFYGADGRVAGFSSACVIRLRLGEEEHDVFHAGVFIDPRYRGGDAAARFGLCEALRVRLARPRARLWYIAGTTSPAPYALYARTVARFYPHPDLATPPEVDAVVEAFKAAIGLTSIEGRPYLVSHDRWPRLVDHEHARRARSLAGDRMAAFFLQQNPCFEDGTRLLVAMPLDWKDVAHGLLSPFRALLRRRARGVVAALPDPTPFVAAAPVIDR